MKSEEQVKQQLIKLLRKQADILEKNEDVFDYKVIRSQIPVLEDILELNRFDF